MRSSERRAISRLPVSASPWEVALLESAVTISGVDIEGLLVVVEQSSELVRAAGPLVVGKPIWTVLGLGLFEPVPPASPARPARLLCADGALFSRLQRELANTGIAVVRSPATPAAAAALASLDDALQRAPTAPGLTTDLSLWATTLTTACRVAPWQRLPDSVTFRFSGPLAGRVGIVLGAAEVQQGFVLYPDEASYRAFTASAETMTSIADLPADFGASFLYLDAAEDLSLDEITACRAAGLGLPGGRFPRAAALRQGRAAPLDEAAQGALLAAIEAIVGICLTDGGALASEARERAVRTHLGPITVRTQPPLRATRPHGVVAGTPLVDNDHSISLAHVLDEWGHRHVGLVVKLAKRDAMRLAHRLLEVDGLRISGPALAVEALHGGESLGLVAEFEDLRVDAVRGQTRLRLCISAGGSKRARLDAQDFVYVRDLPVSPTGVPPGTILHDPVFDRPPKDWPRMSETVVAFAADHLAAGTSPADRQARLELVTAVWNGVVLADYERRPAVLDAVRERVTGKKARADLEGLVARKRMLFHGDPRIVGEARYEGTGAPRVFATARLPAGFPSRR